MKRFLNIILFVLTVLVVVSCYDYGPETVFYDKDEITPIAFTAGGSDTRVPIVTTNNLESFYVTAYNTIQIGYSHGPNYYWENEVFTKQGNLYVNGNRYWPASSSSAGNYKFVACNRPITGQSNGFIVHAQGYYGDLVMAVKKSGITAYSSNVLDFQHIYARLGTVIVSAKTGFTLSNVSVTMTPKSGEFFQDSDYDFPPANTLAGGWDSYTAQEGTLTTVASGIGTFNPGLCFMPGTYTLNLSWTVTDATGVYTASFSNTKNVEFKMGENTTLNITLGGDPKDIIFTAGVADWETTATQEVDKDNLLCFEFITDGTLFLERVSDDCPISTLEYSRNGSSWNPVFTSWSRYNYAGAPQFVAGDKVFVRGSNTTMASSSMTTQALKFCLTGDAYVYGDISAILTDASTTVPDNAYSCLFSYCGTYLKSHPTKDLVLPAVNIGEYAYQNMFQNCAGLTRMPVIKAESFGTRSCYGMFSGCSSLTEVSKLDVVTLSPFCLSYMFSGCTSLVSVPKDMLLAVDLANSCYSRMFNGCTSLTDAPVLPATSLLQSCYSGMFSGCTSLTNAPVLSATYLPRACYYQMFKGCTNLHRVEACFESKESVSGSDPLYDWLDGPLTGVLVKSPNNTMTRTEMSLPSGWTIENAY